MGFLRGLVAPFRGAAFVARHRLWGHIAGPVLVDVALAGAGIAYGFRFVRHDSSVQPLFATSPVVAWLLVVVLGLLIGAAVYLLLQPVICAPFCDALSEKVEDVLRGTRPRVGFAVSVGRAVAHGILKLALYAIALVVGLALTALTGLGGPLVGGLLAAVFLAYDGFDYPLARRGASFAAKWRYLLVHPGLSLGYGLGTMALYLLPLANVVAPPFAAAGATLAFLEAEPPS